MSDSLDEDGWDSVLTPSSNPVRRKGKTSFILSTYEPAPELHCPLCGSTCLREGGQVRTPTYIRTEYECREEDCCGILAVEFVISS